MTPSPLEFIRHPENADTGATPLSSTELTAVTATPGDTHPDKPDSSPIDDDADNPTARILARPRQSAWPA
ncbi:MAG: hypothetical protein K2J27_06230 [Duncaniella sp.]|nr:hypothetical protein [Duncaniella sp.]